MAKVDLQKFSKEELQKIVAECSDKTELATKLGFTFTNGAVHKKVVELVRSHGISIEHFDRSKKVRARRKYPIIKKNCPVCGEEFETQKGHPRETETCSCKCANTWFSDQKHGPEQRLKVSKSLGAFHELNGTAQKEFHRNCLWCNIAFFTVRKTKYFCSKSCAAKYHWNSEDYRNNLIGQIRLRIDAGLHKGWASRTKLEPSFPEKVVIEILEELGDYLVRERKVNKWFIDFADIERKIAIEIDGKQHELPERKASDAEKDDWLTSQGWTVHRIKWKKLTPEVRVELKNRISLILK